MELEVYRAASISHDLSATKSVDFMRYPLASITGEEPIGMITDWPLWKYSRRAPEVPFTPCFTEEVRRGRDRVRIERVFQLIPGVIFAPKGIFDGGSPPRGLKRYTFPRIGYADCGTKIDVKDPVNCTWGEVLIMGMSMQKPEQIKAGINPREGVTEEEEFLRDQPVTIIIGPMAGMQGVVEHAVKVPSKGGTISRYEVLIGGTFRVNLRGSMLRQIMDSD